MSVVLRRLGRLIAICLLVGACNRASEAEVAEPSEMDKIDAALAALDSGPLPAGLIAYDLASSSE